MKILKNNFLLLLIIISIISSCTKDGDTNQPLDNDVNGSSTQMSVTPNIVDTTTPTQTKTFVPTGTFTPVPTKSVEEREAFINKMYETNGGCDLPCFWGISPGVDDKQTIIEDFSPYGILFDHGKDGYAISINNPGPIDVFDRGNWYISLTFKNDIVETVSGSADYLYMFAEKDINLLLRDLENPAEIWLKPEPAYGSSFGAWYVIGLFYPEKGVFINWGGWIANEIQKKDSYIFEICPNQFVNDIDMYYFLPPQIISWDPVLGLNFDEVNKSYLLNQHYIRLNSENSDANIDQFYQVYISTNEKECFNYFGK